MLPTCATQRMTPHKAWYSIKPLVDHLKVFGYLCYQHILEQLRDKVKPTAQIGIHIGYSLQVKAYRIYLVDSGKVSITRNVIFDEDREWNWEEQQLASTSYAPINMIDNSNIEYEDGSGLEADQIIDDETVRKTRTIETVYARCQLALVVPASFEEVAHHFE